MFAKTIIDSDAFLDMPTSARLLYYDLGMRADDDGFVNSPKKIMRVTGASLDDMNILIAKKFIIPFESGIVVIKHWRIHNYIRKDTYNETTYLDEKKLLTLDENKAYTMRAEHPELESLDVIDTDRRRAVDEPSTQVNKDNKVNKDNQDNKTKKKPAAPDPFGSPDLPESLRETLKEFEAMRKSIKKPMTARAKELLLSNLAKLSTDTETQIKILNQSILNSWQDVYPLKEDHPKQQNQPKQPTGSFYRMEEHDRAAEEDKAIEQALLRKGRKI